MTYDVHVVGDDELPAGIHQVIVERTSGPPLLLLNGAPARCWLWMRAYEAAGGQASLIRALRVA